MTQLRAFPDEWQRASVIVAHPDDIEWGVAGAVAAWTGEGKTVSYVLVTYGEAGIETMTPDEARVTREAEERASGEIVGVSDIEFLGHPDGRIVEDLALRRDIAGAIRRQRPDVVVAQFHGEHWGPPGSGWNSSDHRAVGRATLDAVADAANRWIFPELEEEPWAGTQWIAIGVPDPAGATHFVDTGAVADVAVRSLVAHAEYIKALGVDDAEAFARQLLDGQAEAIGPHVGGKRAVAFEVLRGPGAPGD